MIGYVILFILDLVATALNYKYLEYIELNPIYKYIGLVGISIINILAIITFLVVYRKSKPTYRYILLIIIIQIMILRVVAIKNALTWIINKPTVQQVATAITPEVKQAAFVNYAAFAYIPMFLGIITFIIWAIDHKIQKKDSSSINITIKKK